MAGCPKGTKRSAVTKAAIGSASSKRWENAEFRKAMTPKLSAAAKARWSREPRDENGKLTNPALRKHIDRINRRRSIDDRWREKLSDAARQYWQSSDRLIRPDERMLAIIHENNAGPVGMQATADTLGITVSTLRRILRDYDIVWRKSRSAAKVAPEVGHPSNNAAVVAASVPDVFPPETGDSDAYEPIGVASFEEAA